MVVPLVGLLLVGIVVVCEVWKRCQITKKLADVSLSLSTLFLRTTRITLDRDQIGHLVPVNDHLKLIRHVSGRSAYLLVPPPLRPRPPMPRMLKAILVTFFTL
jgi:hypothetical protein